MSTYRELHYWNSRSYGKAYRIPKKQVKTSLILACIITPATNWLIPFIHKYITEDFVYRYD